MRTRLGAPLLCAVTGLLTLVGTASAGNVGASNYTSTGTPVSDAQVSFSDCQTQNRTGYKLVYDTVLEKRWHTCYQTVNETIMKPVTKTCYRDECKTEIKTVQERCMQTVQETRCRPVCETL